MSEYYPSREDEKYLDLRRRLARLEDGTRALADVMDFGDDNEEVIRCNWVRDRLVALLDGE